MPIRIDESGAPLMLAEFVDDIRYDDAVQFTKWMQGNFDRGRLVAMLMDVAQAKPPEARVLNVFGDFAKVHVADDRRVNAGFAYVATSMLVKVVLKGFFALQPPSVPYTVVGSRDEAVAWCRQRLAERGAIAG